MIPESEWKWFGFAGHFICGRWCRFHLCTEVGGYLVSTVGQFVHPMHGKGNEQAEAEWLLENPNGQEIGYKRHYETMVFKSGAPCDAEGCKCGTPLPSDHTEVEMDGYSEPGEATAGHIAMCRKVASGHLEMKIQEA